MNNIQRQTPTRAAILTRMFSWVHLKIGKLRVAVHNIVHVKPALWRRLLFIYSLKQSAWKMQDLIKFTPYNNLQPHM